MALYSLLPCSSGSSWWWSGHYSESSASGLLHWEESDGAGFFFPTLGSTLGHLYMVDNKHFHFMVSSLVCSSELCPNIYIQCLLCMLGMISLLSFLLLKAVLSHSQSASGTIGELFIAMRSPVPAWARCLHSYMLCPAFPALKTSAVILRLYFSRQRHCDRVIKTPFCTG